MASPLAAYRSLMYPAPSGDNVAAYLMDAKGSAPGWLQDTVPLAKAPSATSLLNTDRQLSFALPSTTDAAHGCACYP